MHRPGSLRLATSPERLENIIVSYRICQMIITYLYRIHEMNYQLSHQGWNEAPMEFWNPDQISNQIPLLDIQGANVYL